MNNLDISKISSNTVYLYYNNNKDLTYEEKYFSTILKNLVREIILNEDKKILKKWNIEWRKYKKKYKRKYNFDFEYWVSKVYYDEYELYYYLKEKINLMNKI